METNARNERLAKATADLAAAVEQITTSEDWLRYLDFQARFTKYSAGNTLLLLQQAMLRGVEARQLAGHRTWQAQGRQVRKGERGFTVLAPVVRRVAERDPDLPPPDPRRAEPEPGTKVVRGFTTATVFEVSQTEGEPVPEPVKVQALEGPGPEGAWAGLTRLVRSEGFAVSTCPVSELPPTCNGRTDFTARTVVVRDDLEPAQQVKTLAHELAHIRLGHERVASGFEHRDVAEIEAESVAYLICTELDMDPTGYSFGYVASWSGGDVAKFTATAERVRRVAVATLDELEAVQERNDSQAVPREEEASDDDENDDALGQGQ
ncbi:MAG: ArdC-like ssDNA-binding domain-containing protein [Actinomycetota bacterium]|nr:ArdC-like ssDNA-binding domain-containing protein [Actinomycetota bacterium]